jgi:adenylate kinase family enzyme
MKTTPHRIAIVGLPGSGKSTFATSFGKILNIPVHHLDRHMFESNGNKKDKQEFISILNEMICEPSWIVEGCSFSTFELRYAKADTFIYFQYSRLVCFWRVFKRVFNYNKAFGGLRMFNWELIKYIWNFDKEKRGKIEELRAKYPDVNFIIFKKPQEAIHYLTRQQCKLQQQ